MIDTVDCGSSMVTVYKILVLCPRTKNIKRVIGMHYDATSRTDGCKYN